MEIRKIALLSMMVVVSTQSMYGMEGGDGKDINTPVQVAVVAAASSSEKARPEANVLQQAKASVQDVHDILNGLMAANDRIIARLDELEEKGMGPDFPRFKTTLDARGHSDFSGRSDK